MATPKIDIWMPIYIGDYLRDTQSLTAEEHGVYFLLLMHYWQKKGEIGDDIKRLSIVAKSDTETTQYILESFFILDNGNYKNKRADKEIEAAMSRSESARANINKRWNKNSNTTVYTPVIPPYNDGNTGGGTESIRNEYGIDTLHLQSSSSSLPIQEKKEENIIIPPSSVAEIEPKTKAIAKTKPEPDPLYQAIFQSFIAKAGAFTNYPKEAQAIKRIIKYCEQHAPRYSGGDKIQLAEKTITKYYELTQNGDRFWRGQPFTPSNLSAPGIFDFS